MQWNEFTNSISYSLNFLLYGIVPSIMNVS